MPSGASGSTAIAPSSPLSPPAAGTSPASPQTGEGGHLPPSTTERLSHTTADSGWAEGPQPCSSSCSQLPHPTHILRHPSEPQTPGATCQAYVASRGHPPGSSHSSQQSTAQDCPCPLRAYNYPSAPLLTCSHAAPQRAQPHPISLKPLRLRPCCPTALQPTAAHRDPHRASHPDSQSPLWTPPNPSATKQSGSTFQTAPAART